MAGRVVMGRVLTRCFLRLLLLAGLVPAAYSWSMQADDTPAGLLEAPVVFTQIPVSHLGAGGDDDAQPGRFEEVLPLGSRISLLAPSAPSSDAVDLTGEFVSAGRPDVSFDGRRILFVGKRRLDDSFQVWEMAADGTKLRQVTRPPSPVIGASRAIYLSGIFTIDQERPIDHIAFTGRTTEPRWAAPTDGSNPPSPGRAIYTCRTDGTDIRRITFNPNGTSDPYLLSNGRLLFSGWAGGAGQGAASTFGHASVLTTVNPDGTDVFLFAGAGEEVRARIMPCETSDRRVVYVESQPGSVDRGGALVSVALTRSLHTRRTIASDPNGLYRNPSALPDGRLLVSYRSNGGGSYGIYILDVKDGRRTSSVFDAQDSHDLDAVLVQARPKPPGRSSLVDPEGSTGLLYCLNAYLSDTTGQSRAAHDKIARVRVYQALTGWNEPDGVEASEMRKRVDAPRKLKPAAQWEELLGHIPVEPDGSFYAQVPARTPLRLETVGADGRILQSMRSWFWVMPDEARGCIGCHEDRELTPPNRFVSALRKSPYRVAARIDGEHREGRRSKVGGRGSPPAGGTEP